VEKNHGEGKKGWHLRGVLQHQWQTGMDGAILWLASRVHMGPMRISN